MNGEFLKTISKDDLFQWEMLNDFVEERAIDIMNHYVGKSNSDCVEEVSNRMTKDHQDSLCLVEHGHLIDHYDLNIPVNIFIAEDWKEKITKFWDLKKQIAELEK